MKSGLNRQDAKGAKEGTWGQVRQVKPLGEDLPETHSSNQNVQKRWSFRDPFVPILIFCLPWRSWRLGG